MIFESYGRTTDKFLIVMDFHRSFQGLQISPMNISDTNIIKIAEQCYSPLN